MSGRWLLPPLSAGELVPDFALPSRSNPSFHFSTVAGRYALLAFLPADPARRDAALAAVEPHAARFDGAVLAGFFMTPAAAADTPPDHVPGRRWLFDSDGAVAGKVGLGPDEGGWLLLDPALRVIVRAPLEQPWAVLDRLAALPPLSVYAGVPLVAPVLLVPRVFEPELCRRLIDYYDARGGQPTGVMRDVGGRTVGVMDPMKRRSDVRVEDAELRQTLISRLQSNLAPMIHRALQFRATRLERYLIACYDAAEGGHFRPHRDNQTIATAHRRFACSINLNAEDFEGGDLRFPEFGPRTYRPPTGGAVVFCCSLLHEATPVTRGRRYAFLPFLFDEAGERIRLRNQAFLDESPR